MKFKSFYDNLKYYMAYENSVGFGVKIQHSCKIAGSSNNLYKRATFACCKEGKELVKPHDKVPGPSATLETFIITFTICFVPSRRRLMLVFKYITYIK